MGSGYLQRSTIGWLAGSILVLALSLSAETDLSQGTRDLYRGDFDGAIAHARQYLKTHPQSAEAQVLLARVHTAQGKFPEAYQELVRAVRSDPKNTDALYYLGRICSLLGQAEYHKLFQMTPPSYRAHQILAESYLAQNDRPKAEEEYQAALDANPRSVEILDALGDAKRYDLKFDEAVTYYTRAAQLSPRDYDSIYGLGACALFEGQPQQALEHFRQALEINPNSPDAHLGLGDALLRSDQAAAAVAQLKAAVALQPEMRQAYSLLARAYIKLGQTQAADEARRKEQELERGIIEKRERIINSKDMITPAAPHQDGATSPNPQP
jgi:tetratricopeptide (TPR) repeat protein